MGKTYALPADATLKLLADVREKYHPRLDAHGVKIGLIMAFAAIGKDGLSKAPAISGYAGHAAAASVSTVSTKDRLIKGYDVEILLDAERWNELSLAEQTAILDHELTHIEPTGDKDDLDRPITKMRKEDFAAWGFEEIIRRHGFAAMESKAVAHLSKEFGQLALKGFEDNEFPVPQQVNDGAEYHLDANALKMLKAASGKK